MKLLATITVLFALACLPAAGQITPATEINPNFGTLAKDCISTSRNGRWEVVPCGKVSGKGIQGFVGITLEPAMDRGAPYASSVLLGLNVSKATAITGRFGYSDSSAPARFALAGLATELTDFGGACDCSMSGSIQAGRVRSKGKWRTLGTAGIGFPFNLERGISFVPGVDLNYGGGSKAFISLFFSVTKSFTLRH